jgi:hypothetical protein
MIPLKDIVAGVNIDAMQPTGPAGHRRRRRQHRSWKTRSRPSSPRTTASFASIRAQNGYFYRSDHISLAKKGVLIYADSGIDSSWAGKQRAKPPARTTPTTAITSRPTNTGQLGSLRHRSRREGRP